MPDLSHSLQNRDLGHLRIVAEMWGVELKSVEAGMALKELTGVLLAAGAIGELIELLPSEARAALDILTEAGGRIPWAIFTRRFGEIREVGSGRRDRDQIYLSPSSAAEWLFYRALLARAFFDTPSGAQEFAYIPEDMLNIIKHLEREEHGENGNEISSLFTVSKVRMEEPLGRLATPKERAHPIPASDRILDDATTLLAALRMGMNLPETVVPVQVVGEFLRAAKIILSSSFEEGSGSGVQPEVIKTFLEMPRSQAIALLVDAWQKSEFFNELRQIPGLIHEGEWQNSPLTTRHSLLGYLMAIPKSQWWSVSAFVRAIKEKHPDYQRPAGDYDSWFVKRASDGVYLRGFESWDEVDGALVRYLITGPMAWLGLVELATPAEGGIPTAFRLTQPGIRHSTLETTKLHVSSQGRVTIPRLVPRAARYQIARFCEWDAAKPDEFRYRVTTSSLEKAKEQGLKVGQLLSLLARNAAAEVPPAFVKAIKRWEVSGTEAWLDTMVVLRVSKPAVLNELRKSKASRFLGEALGPVAVIVKPGAQAKVLAALAEMGLLAEVKEQ